MWEEKALKEIQVESVGLAHYELASDICKRKVFFACPANDVINDDTSIRCIANWHTQRDGKRFPNAIDIMDERYKCGWPIGWSKRHDVVCPLYSVNPLKCEFLLTRLRNSELVISHRRVIHPYVFAHTEFDENRGIAPRNGVGDNPRDAVQGRIIDTETPNEIINIRNMFLMGFRREYCLKKPTTIRDLMYVSNLGESRDAFTHDLRFHLAIVDFLDGNGPC